MFDLDLKSRLPIYEQLVAKLKELIIAEVLKTDEQLPSVRSLSRDLTINPNTIQKAYRELENQDYIYSLPGKGSFVSNISNKRNEEKLTKLKEELRKLMSEAIYLGMEKEELLSLFSEIKVLIKRGEHD